MPFFKEIANLWNAGDLLSQSWDESTEMLKLSRDLFKKSILLLSEQKNAPEIQLVKGQDIEINQLQIEVRRKILTHFSVNPQLSDVNSGLVLVNMVVDIERLGDYSKNILDLASFYPRQFISSEHSEELGRIEEEVSRRFDITVKAIEDQDTSLVHEIHSTYKELVNDASDRIVNGILTGKTVYGDDTLTTVVALYARYLKRVGAHLKNITSVLINPFDMIGYKSKGAQSVD